MHYIREKITRLSSAKHAYGKTKNTAKRRNIIFKLTFDEFMQLVLAPCYLCGSIKSNTSSYSNNKIKVAESPTFRHNGIDRVDSHQGYVMGNVRPCCSKCNRMKSNLGLRAFKCHIKRITQYNLNAKRKLKTLSLGSVLKTMRF